MHYNIVFIVSMHWTHPFHLSQKLFRVHWHIRAQRIVTNYKQTDFHLDWVLITSPVDQLVLLSISGLNKNSTDSKWIRRCCGNAKRSKGGLWPCQCKWCEILHQCSTNQKNEYKQTESVNLIVCILLFWLDNSRIEKKVRDDHVFKEPAKPKYRSTSAAPKLDSSKYVDFVSLPNTSVSMWNLFSFIQAISQWAVARIIGSVFCIKSSDICEPDIWMVTTIRSIWTKFSMKLINWMLATRWKM